mgnify:CR=1 FL=1
MIFLVIIYILVLIIFALMAFAVMQIKMAGMNVKDFWDFIQANQILNSLYRASKQYEKMSRKEQIIFLMEAEKVFSAFDRVPNMLWEDEYQKYSKILEIYKNIKVLRWNESSR